MNAAAIPKLATMDVTKLGVEMQMFPDNHNQVVDFFGLTVHEMGALMEELGTCRLRLDNLRYMESVELENRRIRSELSSITAERNRLRAKLDRLSAQGGEVPKWIDLGVGDVTREGDQMDASRDSWRDEPMWAPAPAGLHVRDSSYPAHTKFRRPAPPHPDTVEVPRSTLQNAANFLEEYASRVPGISAVIDAIRAQAQPATTTEKEST